MENPTTKFFPPPYMMEKAHVKGMQEYEALYKESVEHPAEFWSKVAADYYWKTPATGKIWESNFDVEKGPIFLKFMEGATTNICYNALDRNVERGLGNKIAFYW